jgi:hypothetical protein
MGDRKIIGSLFCFLTNRAWNRMVIRMQIRTCVGSPLALLRATQVARMVVRSLDIPTISLKKWTAYPKTFILLTMVL